MAESPMNDLTPLGDIREYSVQSQYSASPRILALGKGFQEEIDPEPDIELFYTKIFDISTAEGWGLDNWGRILAISRGNFLYSGEWFGFNMSGLQPFDQGVFYNDVWATSYQELEDDAFRRLLMYKAAANIGSGDPATLNRLLTALFEEGFIYAVPTGVMQVRFVFDTYLEDWDWVLLKQYGIFAKPAGVGWEVYVIKSSDTFGFDGSELQPFNQGVFSTYDPVNVGETWRKVPE